MGIPAPIAASTGSFTTNAEPAPALSDACTTARRSAEVIAAGTDTITSGLRRRMRPDTLFIKYRIMASVTR